MEHKAQLENKKYRNWVRAGLGIKYLKEGLEPFCDHLVNQQHIAILDEVKRKHNLSAVTCGLCDVRTLQPDHVRTKTRQCPLGQSHCNCLYQGGKTSCPSNVCGAIYDEIIKRHAFTPPAPYWKNTLAQKWCTEPWAVAKCFINVPGYEQKKSADEFDCSGFLHLLSNNLEFHQHIKCVISGNDVFSRVLQYRNAIFHSNNMELEDTDTTSYIDDMIELLQDDKEIKKRQESKEAVKKLLELKQEMFIITIKDEEEVRRIALSAIDEREKNFEQKIVDAENKIEVRTDESQQQVKKIGSAIKDELEQKEKEIKMGLRIKEVESTEKMDQKEKEIQQNLQVTKVNLEQRLKQKETEIKENLRMTEAESKERLKQEETELKENLRITEVNSKERLKQKETEIKDNLNKTAVSSEERLKQKETEIKEKLRITEVNSKDRLKRKETEIQENLRMTEDDSKKRTSEERDRNH
ncbi:trichohyalin-like isoform X2 [Mercenaria mercenaria]|uniref:trichohyalin-like isoform X2 n=1 Tax=Mercenaria mercenaria TaxID=6596 RepID=UPI00234EC747|nr:trichohyalin-like isoform X2 [Mercenaria mercenaria]